MKAKSIHHRIEPLESRIAPAATIFIGAIPMLGMYLASAGYIFGVLALPKRKPLLQSLAMAVVTPLALYVVFERLFLVSLPHGALAAAFGF